MYFIHFIPIEYLFLEYDDSASAKEALEEGGKTQYMDDGVELRVEPCPSPPTKAEVKDLEKKASDLKKVVKASKADRGGKILSHFIRRKRFMLYVMFGKTLETDKEVYA